MITQNPIIGHARKKLGAVYARTLYGKNILQSCPPPNKHRETPGEAHTRSIFGELSRMSNQVPATLLNNIFYAAPSGRSRRAQWCKDLGTGIVKIDGSSEFTPSAISVLGGNAVTCNAPFVLTPNSTTFDISFSDLSIIGNADTSLLPCIIMICAEANLCIDMLSYTTLREESLHFENVSTTLLGKECYFFPLWQVNIGTQRTPIYAYGRYQKPSLG